jgi:hypothetical protein
MKLYAIWIMKDLVTASLMLFKLFNEIQASRYLCKYVIY